MTAHQKQQITWLEYESTRLGITIEELRQIMSARSKLSDPAKKGFASMSPEKRRKIQSMGGKATQEKKRRGKD